MASNPLFSGLQSPTNATAPSKAVNDVSVSVARTHNTFDNSYFHFLTQTFGLYQPFHVETGVPGDTIPFGSSHNVRSLPFSSPMLAPMKINKDYFLVPNHAIQPYTWDYIFRSPAQGDDVPDDAQNVFPIAAFLRFFKGWFGFLDSEDFSFSHLWPLLIAENFFSSGSLLSSLGYKLPIRFKNSETGNELSFDDWFDLYIRQFDFEFDLTKGERTISFSTKQTNTGYVHIDLYEALTIFRTFSSRVAITSITPNPDVQPIATYTPIFSDIPIFDYNQNIRLDKVIAYQLACSQFYVNPDVDFIYQSQLFRDNYMTSLRTAYNESGAPFDMSFFEYNGISVPYDYFSLKYYNYLVDLLSMADNGELPWSMVYNCFNYIFGFREQLRFGDYFTDSRTQPLGFGDADSDGVAVVDNSVSVVDMSQRIILQRFKNNTIKLGNDDQAYLKEIFGEDMPPDYHLPKIIVHTEFDVNGEEISNTTSDDQGNIVTNLKSGADSNAYSVDISLPCVLIGISHISIPRIYSQTKDRSFFHQDRYDMFNPMLQYYGDQEVYGDELSPTLVNKTFAYHSRNAEYKQRISIATGAFANSLKAWAFVTDSQETGTRELMFGENQSPEFIRAYPFEFNRFLSRQPGLSLANRYHFIMVYNNKSVQVRPMEVNPSTL